ncbi:MAG: ergothioneine biosynthesis protein EgtB [Minwuia sp.]|uniref:ergothioneine biosynthesis protein EgtB n=1 Tax=Minwuia sp. TaxID=2493630 RepID=UPI003A899F67
MPDSAPAQASAADGGAPAISPEHFLSIRRQSERLAAPLSPEDQVVQAMDDASPTKWHLAHTSWFFETFVLRAHVPGYGPFDPAYAYLFNSYYEGAGPRHPRPHRGLLTRPPLDEVMAYRAHVDRAMTDLLAGSDSADGGAVATLTELGLHHEQQHQELLLTDALYTLSCNPLQPAYRSDGAPPLSADPAPEPGWTGFEGGIREIGHDGTGFAFDCEGPRHEVLIRPFRLADRAVTCGEWQAFLADGGYRRPELWLSDGWATVQREGWTAPLYWDLEAGTVFTLWGPRPIEPAAPVTHVSFYEADAFARWAEKRLPTEAEWEIAADGVAPEGNTAGSDALCPRPAARQGLRQVFGDVWEWTASPYTAYPGFRPPEGAVGEYNGKFMANQFVLRGGSCATPDRHVRATYRNFFYPHQRWQFTGLRLAEDAA